MRDNVKQVLNDSAKQRTEAGVFSRQEMLKMYKVMEKVQPSADDNLAYRQKLRNKIAKMAEGGKIAVYTWGRDCDMCESSRVSLIPASVMAFEKFENAEYEYAEGPTTVRIIWMDEAAEFTPTFRDRIAEAWDNGNTSPYMV